jgi:hypothetical protein
MRSASAAEAASPDAGGEDSSDSSIIGRGIQMGADRGTVLRMPLGVHLARPPACSPRGADCIGQIPDLRKEDC